MDASALTDRDDNLCTISRGLMVHDPAHKLTSLTPHNHVPCFALPIIEGSTGEA